MHLGAVRFPITGPLRYSMDGTDAVELLGLLRPRVAVPVHYEGWSHFKEPVDHLRDRLDRVDAGLRDRVRWLSPGVRHRPVTHRRREPRVGWCRWN